MTTPPSTHDDVTPLADLIRRAAGGDEAAFARLYDDTVPRVYGLVLRVVRDPALAEEVTGTVFAGAWRQAGQYDASRTSVLAWLMTSAHRCAVGAARTAESSSAAGPVRADSADPVHTFESIRVAAALDTLAPDEREAIDLAWGAGYTYREAAELLRTPADGVLGLLRSGLLSLGRALTVA